MAMQPHGSHMTASDCLAEASGSQATVKFIGKPVTTHADLLASIRGILRAMPSPRGLAHNGHLTAAQAFETRNAAPGAGLRV